VTNRRTSTKLMSAILGLSLLTVAACGDDDDDDTTGQTGGENTTTTEGDGGGEEPTGGDLTLGAEQFPECVNPITQCANSSWMHWAVDSHVLPRLMELDPEGNFVPSPLLAGEPVLAGEGVDESGDPFTVTYQINPDAVWDDGTPITCADVEFTWQAKMNTTGVVSQVGYELMESVAPGDEEGSCVVTFTEPFADWWDMFGGGSDYVLKADAFAGPDIADDMNNEIPFSGGPFILESFDPQGTAVLVRNENYWDEERVPLVDSVTMQLQADTDTELNALLAGEVAAIYPQPAPGIADTLATGESTEFQFGAGTTYEGLWFTHASLLNPETPLADPAVREALLFAVNRDEILAEVITPSFPETEILNCGGWVPTVGDWCDNTDFADISFDPEQVDAILTEAGWAKGADGIYAKDGQPLAMTWQTVAGNARREAIQALVIPQLQEMGIQLTADNSDPDTLFQVRLPNLDTEIALYAQVASPDPSVTSIFACENIPSEANEFSGQNNTAWCNEEATELMHESDRSPIPEERVELIHQIGDLVREDAVWMPFYQLPLITAWDTSLVDGPVGEYTSSSYSGFSNIYDWFIPAD
jgi:peptide/nickel transport system substrate-binding protein